MQRQSQDSLPHSYGTFCDTFYLNMRLGSHMPMPQERGTLLHFFEQMQRAYPTLTCFRNEGASGMEGLHLEEPRTTGGYRWLSLEPRRLAAGHVNPRTLDEVASLHKLALRLAPYQLGLSPVEVSYIDVLMGFDLEFNGDHEEIIAETLFRESPLACLLEEPTARPMEFAPGVTFSLNEDRSLQARLEILTRAGSVRVQGDTGEDQDIISVYFTLRRHWQPRPGEEFEPAYDALLAQADELAARHIVPKVLRPISSAIAARS